MVNLNCFFLLLLIVYFYLKLTEDLFTIASGRMIKKKISPGRYAGNNDIFYFGPSVDEINITTTNVMTVEQNFMIIDKMVKV